MSFCFLLIMVNWIISDFPFGCFVFFVVLNVAGYILFDTKSLCKVSMGICIKTIFIPLTSVTFIFEYVNKIKNYDEKLEKIIIPEFIQNRPFRETNSVQKDKILEVILRNVNTKFVSEMKKQYTFKNIEQLVNFLNNIIAGFLERYFERYKDLPIEDIRGWDKMLLVAKNIQDEDLKDLYAGWVSQDTVQKYSSIRPTTHEIALSTNWNRKLSIPNDINTMIKMRTIICFLNIPHVMERILYCRRLSVVRNCR